MSTVLALHLVNCFYYFVGYISQTSTWPNHDQDCYLWCLFPKSCWNIFVWKMLCILLSSLCKNIFSFGFIKVLDFKMKIKYRYCISHGICWHCSFNFCFVTNKICLLCSKSVGLRIRQLMMPKAVKTFMYWKINFYEYSILKIEFNCEKKTVVNSNIIILPVRIFYAYIHSQWLRLVVQSRISQWVQVKVQ